MIRPATIHDVPRIAEVINSHAELGKMLFKSCCRALRKAGAFLGLRSQTTKSSAASPCPSLWADLAEVRRSPVDEKYRGRGIGSRTCVQWSIAEARRLQIRKLMTLTYEQRFFEKAGFTVVEKDTLPLKVWTDCVKCPKNEHCDEIAMVRVLEDVAVVDAKAAAPTPRGVSIPVLKG